MDIVALLPFIVLIGAMFLMTRSAKNKQRAAAQMRNQMQPGTGVRTIGGLYATVKEVGHDVVVVEIAPGVHATFAKNAIGAVLEDEEYERIVFGDPASPLTGDGATVVPDSPAGLEGIDLGKHDEPPAAAQDDDDTPEGARDLQETKDAQDAKGVKDTKGLGKDKGEKSGAADDAQSGKDEDGPAAT